MAGGLARRGVGPGDVVAILSYNCPEFLEALFAANHLGAIAMPINWRLAAPEVRYILEHSGARALVCDDALLPLADEAADGDGGNGDGCWRWRRGVRGGLVRVSIAAGRPPGLDERRRPAAQRRGGACTGRGRPPVTMSTA